MEVCSLTGFHLRTHTCVHNEMRGAVVSVTNGVLGLRVQILARSKAESLGFLAILTFAHIAQDAFALPIVKERALIDQFSRGSTKMSIFVAEW